MLCSSLVLSTYPVENVSWPVPIGKIRRAGGVAGGRGHAEVHGGRCGGLRLVLQDTCKHTSLLYSLQLYFMSHYTESLCVYLCVGRQETLEWWLRYRRLPSAAARPPWRVWEREWEWTETWCLCPAHQHAPWAPSGPVAHLRTAWQHADRSLKPLQTDTESNLGENLNESCNSRTFVAWEQWAELLHS